MTRAFTGDFVFSNDCFVWRNRAPIISPILFLCIVSYLGACAGGGGGSSNLGGVLVDTGQNIGVYAPPPVTGPITGPIYGDGDSNADDYLGTKSRGHVASTSHYETSEYYDGGYSGAPLAISQFSSAYARGWTGTGSVITIADTGVDSDHVDLAANIGYSRDFSGTGIEDNHGHGTHVAGIAAAVRDGVGVHGAAFDATLAIGKVTNTSAYSFTTARDVATWGRDLGSVAVNVSAAYGRDTALENQLVEIGTGSYYLDHAVYGTNGFYNARSAAVDWRAALGDSQLLIKAAGNSGTAYSAGYNQMATASDDAGNLILDGKMLVVGNWDAGNQRITGNQAGNVCVTYVNGACSDAASISDFFIMATGTDIYAPYRNGTYAYLTGTSMAAPLVAGGIAVLHQMWPHMTGKNLAQLILQTANKDIPDYAVHVHGQGLLDMDSASAPVGATGLPLTGRTDGGVSAVTGGISGAGISSAAMADLASVMVLDDYQRDFYVDLSGAVGVYDTRRASLAETAGLYNSYQPYFGDDRHLDYQHQINRNLRLKVGAGLSDGHYFGNSFSGSFGTLRHSVTGYGMLEYQRKIGRWTLSGQLARGATKLEIGRENSLLVRAGLVQSSSLAGIASTDLSGGVFGLSVQQPVHIDRAPFRYRLPVGRTLSGGVVTADQTLHFGAEQREIDYGLFFKNGPSATPIGWKLFAEARTNLATHQSQANAGKGNIDEMRYGASLEFLL